MTDYIATLRKIVGNTPLLRCGASVILINDRGLQKRRDNGCWGFHGGGVELNEKIHRKILGITHSDE